MNKEKLHEAIGMMSQALEEESQAASPQKVAGPPRQPGQVLWDSGIYYMADGSLMSICIIKWIIEKNLLPTGASRKTYTSNPSG